MPSYNSVDLLLCCIFSSSISGFSSNSGTEKLKSDIFHVLFLSECIIDSWSNLICIAPGQALACNLRLQSDWLGMADDPHLRAAVRCREDCWLEQKLLLNPGRVPSNQIHTGGRFIELTEWQINAPLLWHPATLLSRPLEGLFGLTKHILQCFETILLRSS